MLRPITYFVSLVTFFALVFKVLRAINIEGAFKKNHLWEIKAAYVIIALVISHILSEIILHMYDWIELVINNNY